MAVEVMAGAREISLLYNVHIDSGAYPSSYTVDTGGSFLGGKAVGP
jgi:hypothetical protein